jgi:general secretion pathway protein D
LLREQISDTEDKVPFLGDLPGIGRLFRTSQEKGTKTAIMLFVTVKLLDPAGQALNDFARN